MSSGSSRSSDPVLIIGSSRSGTSLLARILASSGVFMGADVESNHESRSLQAANRWVYLNANAGFDAPADGIDDLWRDAFLRNAVVRVLTAHVRGRSSWPFWGWRLLRQPRVWGFKDPRTTYTLPFWLAVFPQARVIHMRRDGLDVARSLVQRRRRVEARWTRGEVDGLALVRQHRTVANRCGVNLRAACAHWEHYLHRASAHVRRLGDQALTVQYEALLAEPAETLAPVSDFLHHPIRPWTRTASGLIPPRRIHLTSFDSDDSLVGGGANAFTDGTGL